MPRRSLLRLLPLVPALGCATDPAAPRNAELVFSTEEHDFGNVMLGMASGQLRLVLVNPGSVRTGEVSIGLAGTHAQEFAITRDVCTGAVLQGGETCVVEVRLRPASTGGKDAIVRAGAVPQLSAATTLRGTGTDIGLRFSSDSMTFGDNVAGTTRALTISLKNWGAVPTGSLVTELGGIGAGAFSITRDGCRGRSLLIGATCDLEIRYAAGALGESHATLAVRGAPGGNTTAQLRGRSGVPVALAASPSPGNFGGHQVGTLGRHLTFRFANQGASSSGVLQTVLGGNDVHDFAITSNGCSRLLRAGESCEVVVRFEAIADGPRSGTLSISDALGSSVVVTLAGTGGTVVLGADKVRVDFGGRMVGLGEAEEMVEVRNSGTISSGPITALCQFIVCDPPFRVVEACGSLLPGAACRLSVRFLPLIEGARQAQFLIGDGRSSTQVAVTGRGTGLSAVASATVPSTTAGVPGPPTMVVVRNTADQPTGPIATLITTFDFEIVANGCLDAVLPPGGNCSIGVRAVARETPGVLAGSLRLEAHPGGTVVTQLAGAAQ